MRKDKTFNQRRYSVTDILFLISVLYIPSYDGDRNELIWCELRTGDRSRTELTLPLNPYLLLITHRLTITAIQEAKIDSNYICFLFVPEDSVSWNSLHPVFSSPCLYQHSTFSLRKVFLINPLYFRSPSLPPDCCHHTLLKSPLMEISCTNSYMHAC